MSILIGLHGLARTGKDTLANALVAQFALYSYAFADPLKQALTQMFNLNHSQLEGRDKERAIDWLGKSPRQLMQLLGTEWGRNLIHPNLWLLLAEQNISNALNSDQERYDGVIVRDVRFENEAEWIRAKGGTVVHILRTDATQVAKHSSENGLQIQDSDIVIHNDAGLGDFYRKGYSALETIRRRSRMN